jgi:hypothetical protein
MESANNICEIFVNLAKRKNAHVKELKRLKAAKIYTDSRLKIYQYTLKVSFSL